MNSQVKTPTLWIAHNYSSDVGYAWANISGLFSSIAQAAGRHGLQTVMSYAQLKDGVSDRSELYGGYFEFDPYSLKMRNVLSLRRNIKKYGIRYAYLTDQPAFGWLYVLLRMFGVRHIISHSRVSVPNPYPPPPESGWRRVCKRTITAFRLLTPDYIYAVSNFVAHRLREVACYPREKIRVIYNGVDMSRFAPRASDALPANLVIFTGCRAARDKGVDIVLRACALVSQNHPELKYRLRYAGDGYYLPTLKALAAELGISDRVDFLGEVKEVAYEIRTATLIVVPSNWGDACPSAVLEALAAGKPLISTLAGGIPELVDDRTTGVLVPPGDASALSRALCELLTSAPAREQLGTRARAEAVRRFAKERYHDDTVGALFADFRLGERLGVADRIASDASRQM